MSYLRHFGDQLLDMDASTQACILNALVGIMDKTMRGQHVFTDAEIIDMLERAIAVVKEATKHER